MKSTALITALLASANTAFAHYRWTNLVANGSTTADYYYVRQNTNYNSPVTDVTSNDIRCNTGTQASAASTHLGYVQAGSTVGLALDQPIYHAGVASIYATKVDNAATADGSTSWFKLAQLPPTFSSGAVKWQSDNMQQYTVKLPASMRKSLPFPSLPLPNRTPASGQYLLRAEHIALHAASGAQGAQFYISCAHINVVGGGSGSPGPLVKFPGAYSATDPGIMINIYYPVPTSYKFPGPAVWSG